MPAYKPYENAKTTSSRKMRKGSRRSVFLANKVAGRLARKARKDARDERAAAKEAAAAEGSAE